MRLLAHHGLLLGVAPDVPSIAGMTSWFDFTNASTMYLGSAYQSGGNVSADGDSLHYIESDDVSGSSYWYALRQTLSDPNAPVYKTPIVNGKSVARFDGTDDVLAAAKFLKSNTATVSDYTHAEMFDASAKTAIVACSVAAGWPYGLAYGNRPVLGDNSNRFQLGFDTSGSPVARAYNYDGSDDTASVAITLNTWMILAIWHDGTNLKVRKNKGSWVSTSSGATSSMTGTPNIGYSASLVGGTSWFQGDVSHLATFNTALVDADVDAVMDYMAASIGLSI